MGLFDSEESGFNREPLINGFAMEAQIQNMRSKVRSPPITKAKTDYLV